MKWRALVFDLDDTLYVEREFVLSGFAAVDEWLRVNHAISGFAAEARRLFEQGVRGTVFDQAMAALGVTVRPELIAELVAVYREHRPQLTLLPEAEWALASYRGLLQFGLITDGYAQTQRNKVAALGLGDRFEYIVYTDDLGRANWKPSPASFCLMMERLGCVGSECLYVADNPAKDFIAPNKLGWLTVHIKREAGEYAGRPEPADPAARAHRTIRSLRELSQILA